MNDRIARTRTSVALVGTLLLGGCIGVAEEGMGASVDDRAAVNQAKIVDHIALNSTIEGQFDPNVRVYGYVFEAKYGAAIRVSIDQATAGANTPGEASGAPLDTYMQLFGPFAGSQMPNLAQSLTPVATSDDGPVSTTGALALSAPPIDYTIQQDGRYLVVFSSWDNTGNGRYKLSLGCQGTDFQCLAPSWTKPCKKETRYIQGNVISGSQTWDSCEIVLLESATVPADTVLTIRPGVTVKGNYLGNAAFGTVTLTVDGTLQAAGTPENPIGFTSFTDSGWGGIVLRGPSHTLSNVYIDRADRALTIQQGATATITDVVLQGATLMGRRSETGVRSETDVVASFTRAVVKGFAIGLHLANARQLDVVDSVVRQNGVGIRIDGTPDPNYSSCGIPPAPPVWRCPTFFYTDIVENEGQGILITGSDVKVQVEHSNIRRNGGLAFELRGGALSPDSFVRASNILDNNPVAATNPVQYGVQLVSYHRSGVVDISGNYWRWVSDPNLGATRRLSCNGQASPTGFSPVELKAGPRLETLTPPVQECTWERTSAAAQ